MIALGVIRKAHGVRGEASVEAWTDSLDRFHDLTAVSLVSPDLATTRPATIEAIRLHAGRALVKFAGIGSLEEVRTLQGWTVEVPDEQARTLEEGEYFLHDLVGLTLVDASGERGKVIDVEETAGGILLVVQGPKRRFDVPFAEAICTKVDLGTKTLTVNLPEGLDEL